MGNFLIGVIVALIFCVVGITIYLEVTDDEEDCNCLKNPWR